LKLIAKRAKPLEQILNDFPKYYTVRDAVKFDIEDLVKIKEKLKKYYLGKNYIIQETGDITGGLKVIVGKKAYVWFRASKTEASVFRVIADSNSEREAEKLLKEGVKLVK